MLSFKCVVINTNQNLRVLSVNNLMWSLFANFTKIVDKEYTLMIFV